MPARIVQAKKQSKYRNRITLVDGIRFASQREANRYGQLKLLLQAGQISDLELQPKFNVIVGGKHICTYRADFTYRVQGVSIVEDAKGYRTREYVLKKKLVEAIYGITILEV